LSFNTGTNQNHQPSDGWHTRTGRIAFHVCRIILALVFIIAAAEKIARPVDFGRAIQAYQLLNGYLISPTAIFIPWIELFAGVLMLFNKFTRPAAIILGMMNIVFIIAIASVMFRGMNIDCGCGLDVGFLSYIVGTQADGWALVRDIIFLAMAVVTYFGYIPKRK